MKFPIIVVLSALVVSGCSARATDPNVMGRSFPYTKMTMYDGSTRVLRDYDGKMVAMIFCFMWVRWTLPRFRYDQVMRIGWCGLLPLALANLVVYAIGIAVFQN